MGTIGGHNGAVYVSATYSSEANSWSLTVDVDTDQSWVFGQAWKDAHSGAAGWGGSVTGLQQTDSKALFTAATSATLTAVMLYPDKSIVATYWSGNVRPTGFSSSMDASPTAVAVGFDFVGDSTLTATGFS